MGFHLMQLKSLFKKIWSSAMARGKKDNKNIKKGDIGRPQVEGKTEHESLPEEKKSIQPTLPENLRTIERADINTASTVVVENKKRGATLISESKVATSETSNSVIESQQNPPSPSITFGDWAALAETVPGTAHRRKGLPCQDYAEAAIKPRPVLIVSDGAGSAAVSELGSDAIGRGLIRFTHTLDRHLVTLLDTALPDADSIRHWALTFIKHSMGLQVDIASTQRRDIKDYRATCLFAVVGKVSTLWVKVGDGFIVSQSYKITSGNIEKKFCVLGMAQKGEYANETVFISPALAMSDVQYGIIRSDELCGIAAMSDGAAEKLVSNDGLRVAGRLDILLDSLAVGKLSRDELTKMFYSPEFCEKSTGDDRGISLISRTITIA
jgi:hypothetical protein